MGTVTLVPPPRQEQELSPAWLQPRGLGAGVGEAFVAHNKGLGDCIMLKMAVTKLGANLALLPCPAAVLLWPVSIPKTPAWATASLFAS